jgi:hypothetical protein
VNISTNRTVLGEFCQHSREYQNLLSFKGSGVVSPFRIPKNEISPINRHERVASGCPSSFHFSASSSLRGLSRFRRRLLARPHCRRWGQNPRPA